MPEKTTDMSLATIADHFHLCSIESQQLLAQGALVSIFQKVDKVSGALRDVGSFSMRKAAGHRDIP